MTDTRLWDRAAALVAVDGRVAGCGALPAGLPDGRRAVHFMRDAELPVRTLRLRIEERTPDGAGRGARGPTCMLRHPGDARVTTTEPDEAHGGDYELWISDGELVRTYAVGPQARHQRPVRDRRRGRAYRDFPGAARVYEPVTALPFETLADTFIHPAGYCQNVLATGRLLVAGTDIVHGREAILVDCAHPRAIELSADRPDFQIPVWR